MANALRSGCWCEKRAQPAPAPEIPSCCSVQGNCGIAEREVGRGKGRRDFHISTITVSRRGYELQRACPSRAPVSFSSSICFCCWWIRA